MPDPFYAAGSATSKAAAEAAKPRRLSKAHRIFNRLLEEPLTCDETMKALGYCHQTCSARMSELTQAGCIRPSKLTRTTRQNEAAAVYEVVPEATFDLYRQYMKKKARAKKEEKALLEHARSFAKACIEGDADEKRRWAAEVLKACQRAYPEG